MKVALCLHGLFGSTTDLSSNGYDGYCHIKKNILDVVDTDVFVHSWEPHRESVITEMYNPKLSKYQKQIDFSNLIEERGLDKLNGKPRSPQSVLSHLYSVNESIKLAFESDTEYDIIIKARFDLGRINRKYSGPHNPKNPYPVQCINFNPNIEANKIYMADWNHFHMGPADMWFYGSPMVMREFGNLYVNLEKQMKIDSEFHQFATQIEGNSGDLSNSIAFYKWWMMKNGLWNKRINLKTKWE